MTVLQLGPSIAIPKPISGCKVALSAALLLPLTRYFARAFIGIMACLHQPMALHVAYYSSTSDFFLLLRSQLAPLMI
jgi:hypothetical protein